MNLFETFPKLGKKKERKQEQITIVHNGIQSVRLRVDSGETFCFGSPKAYVVNKLPHPGAPFNSILELSDGSIVTELVQPDSLSSTICRWNSDFKQLIRTYGQVKERIKKLIEIEGQDVEDLSNSLYFASGGTVWNANTGQSLDLWLPHQNWILKLRRNRISGLFVSDTKNCTLLVWQIRDGKVSTVAEMLCRELEGVPMKQAYELEDGRVAAIAQSGIALFEMRSYRCIQVFSQAVGRLQFRHSELKEFLEIEAGKVLMHFAGKSRCAIWNMITDEFKECLMSIADYELKAVALSYDRKTIVSVSKEFISLWLTNGGICSADIPLRVANVREVASLRDSRFLISVQCVSSQRDNSYEEVLIEIKLPSIHSVKPRHRVNHYAHLKDLPVIRSLAMLDDGSFVSGVTTEHAVTRWSFDRSCSLQTFPLTVPRFPEQHTLVALTPVNETTFASFHLVRNQGNLKIWCLSTGKSLSSFDIGSITNRRQLTLLRSGILACYFSPISICFWSLDGTLINTVPLGFEVVSLCELEDGRLVIGTYAGHIKVYLIEDGCRKVECVQTLGRESSVNMRYVIHIIEVKKKNNRRLREDQTVVVTCSRAGRVVVWDLTAGLALAKFSHRENIIHPSSFTAMTLLADDTVICTSRLGLTKTWDLNGRCLSSFSFVGRPFPEIREDIAFLFAKDNFLMLGYNDGRFERVRMPLRLLFSFV